MTERPCGLEVSVSSELSASSCGNTPPTASLYPLLAEEAPASSVRGETIRTTQKETLDNDREALVPGLLDG
jgi:hypothetical protein